MLVEFLQTSGLDVGHGCPKDLTVTATRQGADQGKEAEIVSVQSLSDQRRSSKPPWNPKLPRVFFFARSQAFVQVPGEIVCFVAQQFVGGSLCFLREIALGDCVESGDDKKQMSQ